jgi:hypothetical protein
LEGSLPPKPNFLKLKHENVIKMKNKPDPALLQPSNLSNQIKKVSKSRETIPLSGKGWREGATVVSILASAFLYIKERR